MNGGRALRSCCSLVLSAGLLAGWTYTAHANEARASSGQPKAAPAYVAEARTCTPCHSKVVERFGENPHAQAPVSHGGKGVRCASCHGNQEKHVKSGVPISGALDPALGTGRQVDDMCLSCHQSTHPTFNRSAHNKSNVSCSTCHSIHSAGTPKYLLKAEQTALCYQCHAAVRPQFSMPSRHNVEEGLVQCTDCHDPHGTSREEVPGSFSRQDAFCANCHTGIEGPFVFEHPIVKTEGCSACHFPHGGLNRHLLRRANVDAICQVCHLPPRDPRTGAHMPSADDHAEPSKSCIDCHTDVHGSNSSRMFFRIK